MQILEKHTYTAQYRDAQPKKADSIKSLSIPKILCEVLEHIPDNEKGLRELENVHAVDRGLNQKSIILECRMIENWVRINRWGEMGEDK